MEPGGILSRDILELIQPICLAFHCGPLFLPSIILFFSASKLSFFFHSIFLSRPVTNKHSFENECNPIFAFPAFISFMLTPKQVPIKGHEPTPPYCEVGTKPGLGGIMSHPRLSSPLNQFLPMNLLPQHTLRAPAGKAGVTH